jgi:hypothetical protein
VASAVVLQVPKTTNNLFLSLMTSHHDIILIAAKTTKNPSPKSQSAGWKMMAVWKVEYEDTDKQTFAETPTHTT